MWFVTVEKNGKSQRRMIAATSESEAGRKVCELIGGQNADRWLVSRCVSAE